MVGPLVMASPNEINLPKYAPFLSDLPAPIATLFDFDVNGVVSGIGIFQNHAVVGDFYNRIDVSNAEAIIQKADGVIQYYLQVGGYSIPALGTPYVNLAKAVNQTLWALAGCLSQDRADRQFFNHGRQSPDALWGRVHFHFRKHEYRARAAVESGERHQSRPADQLYLWTARRIGELEQWLLLAQLYLGRRVVGMDDKSREYFEPGRRR